MAVESTMLELGTKAPDFTLHDVVSGRTYNPEAFERNKAFLLMFICNHCPYVKLIKEDLVEYASDYMPKGVGIVAISSNDIENYPEDAPDKMKEDAEEFGYPFPYLFDKEQEAAHAYKAACTPDLFLFDENQELYYRGQFDSARPKNDIEPTGEDLRDATDRLLAGEPAPEKQIPSMGCNIKWKKGNEPAWYG
ncbi:MAG: thioredoxin family protein [Balneolaceae bacterium]|nr:thioredoxin family protein [Balneolaceae bacterium]MDR9407449.1 thioredoxin family protein [Balneolaceae bacterium]